MLPSINKDVTCLYLFLLGLFCSTTVESSDLEEESEESEGELDSPLVKFREEKLDEYYAIEEEIGR